MENTPNANVTATQMAGEGNTSAPVQEGSVSYTEFAAASQKPKIEYSLIESAFAVISFVCGFLFIKLFPAAFRPLGSFIFTFVMFASAYIFMMLRGIKQRLFPAIWAGSGLLLSFAMLFNSNVAVNTVIFIYVAIAYSYWIFSAFGNSIGKRSGEFLISELIKTFFIMPFKAFSSIFGAVAALFRKSGISKFLLALCGLLCAAIPTSIIIALLSYDANFSKMIDGILSSPLEFVADNFPLFILSIPVSMYLYGMLFSCSRGMAGDIMTYETCTDVTRKMKAVSPVMTVFTVLPIFAVYIIYFISQSSYYLSAFSGKLPEDLSYAEYARSGFFELCAVAFINVLIIAAVNAYTKNESKASALSLKLINIGFPVATLILITTALSKMLLYIDEYGLTVKRVLTTWFMLMMFVGFVIFIIKQFSDKINLTLSLFALLLAFSIPLSFCNIDGIIAKYNVEQYLNGSLSTIDIGALDGLGASAIPELIKLRDSGKCDEALLDSVNREILYYSSPESAFSFSIPDMVASYAIKNNK